MAKNPETVREICEDALMHIGAYSIHDEGAQHEDVERAARFFDKLLKDTASKQRQLWAIRTAPIALTANTQEYTLVEAMGDDAPDAGMMFPVSALVRDADGNDTPVKLVTRQEYDAITDKADTGMPCVLFIDRLSPDQTMKPHPVAAEDDLYTIYLTFQQFNPDPTARDVENRTTGLRANWGLWAGFALAEVLSYGAVRKLPEGEIQTFKTKALELWGDLTAYDDHEHADEPPIGAAWGV